MGILYPLPLRRTYTTEVYLLDDGGKQFDCHVGHIHFRDSLGAFQKIDTTLESVTGGWGMEKSSYRAFLPANLGDWFKFQNDYDGANHLIRAKCRNANPVNGVPFSTDEGNGVIYPQAYGNVADLIVYAAPHGLKKVVRCNTKPAGTGDVNLDFLIDLPKIDGLPAVFTAAATPTQWNGISELNFTGQSLRIGGVKPSWFKRPVIWDASGRIVDCPVSLFTDGEYILFRKTIPRAVLNQAVYPLYTDHPTNYYAGAGDGPIIAQVTNSVADPWDDVHHATTGTAVPTSSSNNAAFVRCFQSPVANYTVTISRAFLPVNTNGISGTITAATVYVYPNSTILVDGAPNAKWTIVTTSQASPTTLANADFDNFNITSRGTKALANITTGSFQGIDFSDLTVINPSGYTQCGIVCDSDRLDANFGQAGTVYDRRQGSNMYYSEDTGSRGPYYSITTSGGGEGASVGGSYRQIIRVRRR